MIYDRSVMNPRPLLHLEGAAVLAVSVFAYHSGHGSWGLFALLFLMPDASMVGYLANAQIGAAVYNAVHTYLGSVLLGAYFGLDSPSGAFAVCADLGCSHWS